MSGSGKREVKQNPNFEEQPGMARTQVGRSAAPSGSGGSPAPPTCSQSVAEGKAVAGDEQGEDEGWTKKERRRKTRGADGGTDSGSDGDGGLAPMEATTTMAVVAKDLEEMDPKELIKNVGRTVTGAPSGGQGTGGGGGGWGDEGWGGQMGGPRPGGPPGTGSDPGAEPETGRGRSQR